MPWPEVQSEPHPVQLQPVEIIALCQFPNQLHMVPADLRPGVIECPVGPLGKTVIHPPEFGMVAPEGAVYEVTLIVDVVHVVHAHRNPRRNSMMPAARNPAG